jgi:hypothetical protein
MWKEVVMTNFKELFQIFGVFEKNQEQLRSV